jgi:hypothetical protein
LCDKSFPLVVIGLTKTHFLMTTTTFLEKLLSFVPERITNLECNNAMTFVLTNDGKLVGFYALDAGYHCYNNEQLLKTAKKSILLIRRPYFHGEWQIGSYSCDCNKLKRLWENDLPEVKDTIQFKEAERKRFNLRPAGSC